jgi:hypothetical protein
LDADRCLKCFQLLHFVYHLIQCVFHYPDLERTGATALRAQIEFPFFSKAEQKLPKVAYRGISLSDPSGPTLPLGETLDFLEAKPYWVQSTLPINVAKQKDPFIAEVLSSQEIVGPPAANEINNVVIDHRGEVPYWEGQSYGVLPPGINPKKNKPHGVRFYSIASTRSGDDKLDKATTLRVRRAILAFARRPRHLTICVLLIWYVIVMIACGP